LQNSSRTVVKFHFPSVNLTQRGVRHNQIPQSQRIGITGWMGLL